MTQNPYAQFGGGDSGPSPYTPDFGDQPQSRTSILAIISLVLSVIGCVCFVVPGPGALAMLLGGISILLIMTSGGRVRGIGFAATAVCLGLLQSIVFFVALFGVYQPIMGGWTNTVIAPVNDVLMALEKKDPKAARAFLTPRAQTVITEDMLTDFTTKYQAKLGAFKGFPTNPFQIVSGYQNVAQAMQKLQTGNNRGNQNGMIPLPGTFEKGTAMVVLHLDDHGFNGNKPPASSTVRMPVLNIGIVTVDGTEIWILDTDKAKALPPDGGTPGESTIEDAPKPGELPPPPRPRHKPGSRPGRGTPPEPAPEPATPPAPDQKP
jgi:hypothetical protein